MTCSTVRRDSSGNRTPVTDSIVASSRTTHFPRIRLPVQASNRQGSALVRPRSHSALLAQPVHRSRPGRGNRQGGGRPQRAPFASVNVILVQCPRDTAIESQVSNFSWARPLAGTGRFSAMFERSAGRNRRCIRWIVMAMTRCRREFRSESQDFVSDPESHFGFERIYDQCRRAGPSGT